MQTSKYTFKKSLKFIVLVATLICVFAALVQPQLRVHAITISTTAWYNVINQNSNKCVDDANWGTANGSIVQQWACGNAQSNQRWQFTPTDSGYYKVTSMQAAIVWDIKDFGTTNGSLIHLWGYGGGNNQQWYPEDMGGGYMRFRSRNVWGRCLDVPGASTADGVQLQIYDCNGTAAQNFRLSDPAGGGSGFVVSQAQFESWFSGRNGLYQYNNFITARNSYSGFAPGFTNNDKMEAAAFFAHIAHETSYLFYTREINQSAYCAGGVYGCAGGQSYFGRGPLQITWNYNYKMAATGNYYANGCCWEARMTPGVGADIWANPDLVATDGLITWKTALWYWMTHGKDWDPAQPTTHDDIINIGFGETTRDINGGLECGQPAGSTGYNQMVDRANIYGNFLANLGGSDGRSRTC